MNRTIKTGLLSFGTSGKIFHAPFLDLHPGFEFKAVVERSEKKAQKIYSNVVSYNTVDELLSDKTIDLVVVNTPNATHFEFALQAIQAGKHVLLEKPFALTSIDAAVLFKEAQKHRLHILPYQNRRYDSDFLSVKNVLDSGVLGKLVEVHFRFDRYRYAIGSKIAKETPVAGSGLLYDLGPHLIDNIIHLFGKPLSWTKNLGHFRPGTQVDDFVHLQLLYLEELQVFITISMLVADVQPAFVLNGTLGSYVKGRCDAQERQLMEGMKPDDPSFGLENPGDEGILTLISEEGIKVQELVVSEKASYLNLFEEVFQTIKNGNPYPITEKQILQQMELLEG